MTPGSVAPAVERQNSPDERDALHPRDADPGRARRRDVFHCRAFHRMAVEGYSMHSPAFS